jgi:hypothetical protein
LLCPPPPYIASRSIPPQNSKGDFDQKVKPNLSFGLSYLEMFFVASSDRVALDAVGVAILRSYCSTNHIMKGRIFELDQLRRASELEIGVKSPSEIRVTPLTDETQEVADKIAEILKREG